jgi:hypothetical protein
MSNDRFTKTDYGTGFNWIIFFFVMFVAIGTLGTIYYVFSTGSRVVTKTLDTNNIISSYEWFHDTNGAVNARVAQIKNFKTLVAQASNDPAEGSRLRIELSAIQQSCRDMTTKYNAQSGKMNKAIFKNGVPERLEPSVCE